MTLRLIYFLILLAFLCPVAVSAQTDGDLPDMFRDVPLTHWAYKEHVKLLKAGLGAVSTCTAFGKHRTLTRYEFGVLVDRCLKAMAGEDKAFTSKKHPHAHRKFTPELRVAILRLAEEFRPELESLRDLTRKRR